MIIFKFRMLSDENDHFVRDYEVSADMTLLQLNDFIIETLEYEPCITSFFTADREWEKLKEFTTLDMEEGMGGDSQPMDSVQLKDILLRVNDRLIFLFDMFGNRAYYMELVDVVKSEPDRVYPREAFAHATPPDQYDPSANTEDASIFDEMMGDFNEFEGNDAYDDEY